MGIEENWLEGVGVRSNRVCMVWDTRQSEGLHLEVREQSWSTRTGMVRRNLEEYI